MLTRLSWNGVDSPSDGLQFSEQRRKHTWIELDCAELPPQIVDGSSSHLTIDCHVAGVIGRKDTQTQIPRTDALHDGFAVPPINQAFQRPKEA
jgi:hypothetical protein